MIGIFLFATAFLFFAFDDAKGTSAASLPISEPANVIANPRMSSTTARPPALASDLSPALPVAGSAFGSVIIVNSDSNILHPEPVIAIDPNNSNRILAASMVFVDPSRFPDVYYYLSTNGGMTWSQGKTTKSNGAIGHIHGWVAFDNLGNGYLIQLAENPNGLYMARLPPSNVWSLAYPVILDAPDQRSDEPRVLADRTSGRFANRVYMSWTSKDTPSSRPRIYLRYVEAANFPNWSPQVMVSMPSADADEWSYIAIGADGVVYVAYLREGTTNQILLAKSMDGGVSFTRTYTVAVANKVYNGSVDRLLGGKSGATSLYLQVTNGPLLVAHPTDPNNLAAVWMDGYNCTFSSQRQPEVVRWPRNDPQLGWVLDQPSDSQCPNAHIVASHSTDGGVSWSPPVVVNDDGDAGNRDHFLPALTVGSDATLHASWYDRRLVLNCTNPYLYNVVYSSSTDWGQTWSHNIRVSSTPSDPANPNFGSLIYGDPTILFLGWNSGIAVTADGSAVWPIWTQTSLGVQKIATNSALTPISGPFITSACYYLPLIMKNRH